MLSFLRARATRSSPRCDAHWDGRMLTLALDPACGGEHVALDLDEAFFADAPIDAQGRARFAFAFAPNGLAAMAARVRRGRDGEVLTEVPFAIRFGEAGIEPGSANASGHALADVGGIVPRGIDCAAHDVVVVVPVYNAPALVERCLDSVLEHTTGRARLLAIDDASSDPAVAPLLRRYAARANVEVLRNARNLGFTATANRGIAAAGDADVVLLNADAEVGPMWLTGLRRAAFSGADVATATAVSDNAGAFSVPELERENTLPGPWTFDQTARALWQQAGRAYPALPTGNGFCMYIRRAAIDAVGVLDEAAFPQGYGEENDFCQRASARGMRHLVAGNVYVRHARSSSFGHERRVALGEAGMAMLRQRWPDYEADVAATLHSFERRVLDWRVRRVFARAGDAVPALRVAAPRRAAARVDRGTWQRSVHRSGTELTRSGRFVVYADADAGAGDECLWSWLQTSAAEAVIVGDEAAPTLQQFASALGLACARIAPGASVDAAVSGALAASRSFPEPTP